MPNKSKGGKQTYGKPLSMNTGGSNLQSVLANSLLQQMMAMGKQNVSSAFSAGYGSSNGGSGGGYDAAGLQSALDKLRIQNAGDQNDLQRALEAIALKRKEAGEAAGVSNRALQSDATARGAMTAGGTAQGFTDIGTQLQNALSGLNIDETDARTKAYLNALMYKTQQAALQGKGGGGFGGGSYGGGGSGYSGYASPAAHSAAVQHYLQSQAPKQLSSHVASHINHPNPVAHITGKLF